MDAQLLGDLRERNDCAYLIDFLDALVDEAHAFGWPPVFFSRRQEEAGVTGRISNSASMLVTLEILKRTWVEPPDPPTRERFRHTADSIKKLPGTAEAISELVEAIIARWAD